MLPQTAAGEKRPSVLRRQAPAKRTWLAAQPGPAEVHLYRWLTHCAYHPRRGSHSDPVERIITVAARKMWNSPSERRSAWSAIH